MAHSYTPGLKVLKKTLFRKERILPLKGKVHVKKGDKLSPDTVVASTNLPGNIQMLKVNNILNIEPRDVVDCLVVKEGDSIKKGDSIAIPETLYYDVDVRKCRCSGFWYSYITTVCCCYSKRGSICYYTKVTYYI